MPGALDGIRVFDWTLYGVGPFASALLGSLGAEVIKIEGPKGDPQIGIPPTVGGVSAFYINFNLNKQCVTLDLKNESERETALKLLTTCDVFLNNMRLGTPEKLGLGYDTVSRINPRIVYCVCTGYGSTGPLAELGGGDPMVQAFCGWTSITGQPDGRGELLRQMHQIDMNASIYVVAAILEALYARERTGAGQSIDISMLSTAIAMQRTRLVEHMIAPTPPRPLGSAVSSAVPHQAFRCEDREYLAVGVEEDSQWQGLCSALGAEALASDPRYTSNRGRLRHREELVPRLEEIFATRPLAWWKLQLERHGVPCARLFDFERLRHHPQVARNRYLPDVSTPWGSVVTGGVPWRLSATPGRMRGGSRPDEDTRRIVAAVAEVELRPSASPEPCTELPDGPLGGLLVAELSQGVAGPYCGELLADAGARVIKVEPAAGDFARQLGPQVGAPGGPAFLAVNRNKESAVFEGKHGRRALRSLLARADVVLQDFSDVRGRPLRPTYRTVARDNPEVVFASFSPFGERGPMRALPGSELVIQFMAGIPAGLGRIGDPPIRLGADACSVYAGVYGFQAVLAALFHRSRSGKGQRVAVSLLGSTLHVKGPFWVSQTAPEQWGPPHLEAWTEPPQHGLPTKDLPVMFGFPRYSQTGLRAILQELGADPADADLIWGAAGARRGSGEIRGIWERAFARHTSAEIFEVFARHRGEILVYNTYPSLLNHPQVQALDMVHPVEHPQLGSVPLLGPAWRLQGTPERAFRSPPPLLGQHTDAVLRELEPPGSDSKEFRS